MTSTGSPNREIHARLKSTNDGMGALNRTVVSQWGVPTDDKLRLCATLADTRLLLYAGTWTRLNAAPQQLITWSSRNPY